MSPQLFHFIREGSMKCYMNKYLVLVCFLMLIGCNNSKSQISKEVKLEDPFKEYYDEMEKLKDKRFDEIINLIAIKYQLSKKELNNILLEYDNLVFGKSHMLKRLDKFDGFDELFSTFTAISKDKEKKSEHIISVDKAINILSNKYNVSNQKLATILLEFNSTNLIEFNATKENTEEKQDYDFSNL